MGSNSTQAQGIVLFLVAAVLLAGAFASSGNVLMLLLASLFLGLSVWRFRACKAPE